ncbi:MAG TPA: C39 family peptidase [Chthoniobacteraceae bacterium]|nr:C39 family peptidase [Chthoniobacteraceae bacterium]
MLSSRAHYSQRDERWASEPIGGSGKPLRRVGCTVCCLSMALAQHGIQYTPRELNRTLKELDAYTSKGWVRWAAISQLTGGKVHAEILRRPRHQDINQALLAGNPVLVKVAPPSMVQHWVLLVGRDGREFLVKDPLDGTNLTKPLSALGSDILAVRVVKKKILIRNS